MKKLLLYTANDLSLVSTDLICVKNPPTKASEFSRYVFVIFHRKFSVKVKDSFNRLYRMMVAFSTEIICKFQIKNV